MKPKERHDGPIQSEMLKVFLKDIVSDRHHLVQLADMVEWRVFEERLAPTFYDDNGRPGMPVRLHYLKYTYGLSDEAVVEGWIENPYWQYFCGGIFFEHGFPIDPSSLLLCALGRTPTGAPCRATALLTVLGCTPRRWAMSF